MSTHSTNESGDFGFQIAPMVDVVFVLLLFFMAVAGQQQIEKRLSIHVPSRGPEIITPVVLDIDSAGHVSLGGESKGGGGADHDLAVLIGELRGTVRGSGDPVLIRPADDTPQERVMDVLAACRKAEIYQIAFR